MACCSVCKKGCRCSSDSFSFTSWPIHSRVVYGLSSSSPQALVWSFCSIPMLQFVNQQYLASLVEQWALRNWTLTFLCHHAILCFANHLSYLCELLISLLLAQFRGFLFCWKFFSFFMELAISLMEPFFFTEASPCLTHQSVLWSPMVLRTILFRQTSLSPGKKILLDGVKASIYWRLESRIEISRQWNIVKGNQVVLACYMECHMLTIGGQNFKSKFRSNSLLYHSPDRSLLVNWNYHCHQM